MNKLHSKRKFLQFSDDSSPSRELKTLELGKTCLLCLLELWMQATPLKFNGVLPTSPQNLSFCFGDRNNSEILFQTKQIYSIAFLPQFSNSSPVLVM